MTRLAARILAGSWLAALAVGCGIGTSAVVASGDGGTNTVEVEVVPTSLSARAPAGGPGGRVPLLLDVGVDPEHEVVLTAVEYSLIGDVEAGYRPATPALGFPADVSVGVPIDGADAMARGGEPFRFDWNADFDLDAQRKADPPTLGTPVSSRVVLRARLENTTTGESFTAATDEFFLDSGLVRTVAGGGVGDGVEPAQAAMLGPGGAAADASGFVYVADTGNHRIRLVDRDARGNVRIRTVAGNGFAGVAPGVQPALRTSLSLPTDVVVDAAGNLIFSEIDEEGGGIVRRVEAETGLLAALVDDSFLTVALEKPVDLALGADGVLWIADEAAGRVWRVETADVAFPFFPAGAPSVRLFAGFDDPVAVAAAPAGAAGEDVETVFVVERSGLVRALEDGVPSPDPVVGGGDLDPAELGEALLELDALATDVRLTEPTGVAVDGQHLFVCDRAAAGPFVLVVDRGTGAVVNVLQDELIAHPADVEVDPFGTLFVVEEGDGALATGATGQMLLAVAEPEVPSSAAAGALAGEDGLKTVTQTVDDLAMRQDGVGAFSFGGT